MKKYVVNPILKHKNVKENQSTSEAEPRLEENLDFKVRKLLRIFLVF